MTLRGRRRDGGLRPNSGRFGRASVPGAAANSSTCRLRARPVRCYISRRRVETTADLRRTVVALSPPGAALGHFRTRAKNPPERTRSRVAIFRHGCTHRSPSSSTSSPSPSLVVDDNRTRYFGAPCAPPWTRRDATPGTRSDFAVESKLRYRLCRPAARARFYITCRGARKTRRE